ncbi:Replication factor C, subunit RFC4 [Coemansia sp. Cherry 401B]|nr:Replication factor C, subunit RFC4 [Coemansia sp. RSA 2704]KAJ2736061.1 Replication factor C, subunit RFC4 [Coemansia sp. Cherry 401B]
MARHTEFHAEQAALDDIIFKDSMFALGATFVGASALSAIAYRFSPGYRSTPISAKTAFILGPTLGAFYIRGEHVGSEFRRQKYMHQLEPHEQRELLRQQQLAQSRRSIVDRAAGFVNQHRWAILGYTWLTGMAGSAYYLYRKKGMSTSQKVVQARMYAQLITIIGILSTAAVASLSGQSTKHHPSRNSAELDAILAEDTKIPIKK